MLFKHSVGTMPYEASKLPLLEVGMAGGLAGWMATFIYCPIEYFKIQRQLSRTMRQSSIGLLMHTLFKKGIHSIYRGFWLTSLRQLYGSFFYYFTYESVVRLLSEQKRD